jgi:hypothetical protein
MDSEVCKACVGKTYKNMPDVDALGTLDLGGLAVSAVVAVALGALLGLVSFASSFIPSLVSSFGFPHGVSVWGNLYEDRLYDS